MSKPLGTGIITTAHKQDMVEADDLDAALQSMMRLNDLASRALQRPGVHAVTDITGFGLLGHAWEMASQSGESGVSMRFFYDALPQLPHVRRYIEQGCIPGGARRNEKYLRTHVSLHERLGLVEREILWDPQTSGGLFAAIDPAVWPELASLTLQEHGVQFWHIGEVEREAQDARSGIGGAVMYEALEEALGVHFRDTGILKLALTHRSYIYETPGAGLSSNERLEFLGDAILNCICADYLYRAFPELSEGDLSDVRAVLVRGETLAQFAREIDLGPHLILGKGEAKSGLSQRVLAAAFEAILGAIYLDQGFEEARRFLLPRLEPLAQEIVRLTAIQR